MKKPFAFVAAALLAFMSIAQAAVISTPPGILPDAAGNVPRSYLNYTQQKLQAVCSNANENTSIQASVGQNVNAAGLYYCPHGFTALQPMLSGVYSNANETKLQWPLPIKMQAGVAYAPWIATATYTNGQCVMYFILFDGTSSNPVWCSTDTNTNSLPGPNNADWSAGAAITMFNFNCGNGQPFCMIPAGADAISNAVQTQGTYLGDQMTNFSCAAACYIYIKVSTVQYGTQQQAVGQSIGFAGGGYYVRQNSATAVTDNTGTGAYQAAVVPTQGSGFSINALLGVPATATPCIIDIGDSRELGIIDAGLTTLGNTSGGTNYKVGEILSPPNTGASAQAVGVSYQEIVETINAGTGAITAETWSNGGVYANPGTTGQTLPSGAQTMSGGSGTGATSTPTFSTTGGSDYVGDFSGARGPIARAAASLGIPVAKFAVGGDRENLWTGAAVARMANIGVIGCATAVDSLGINDITAGQTALQIEANKVNVAQQLKARGVTNIILDTLPVAPQSTDGFTTFVNQTVSASNSERVAFNTWCKALPNVSNPQFAGCLDLAAYDEDTVNSGKVKIFGPDGTTPAGCVVGDFVYTCAGTHRSPADQAGQAALIQSTLSSLVK